MTVPPALSSDPPRGDLDDLESSSKLANCFPSREKIRRSTCSPALVLAPVPSSPHSWSVTSLARPSAGSEIVANPLWPGLSTAGSPYVGRTQFLTTTLSEQPSVEYLQHLRPRQRHTTGEHVARRAPSVPEAGQIRVHPFRLGVVAMIIIQCCCPRGTAILQVRREGSGEWCRRPSVRWSGRIIIPTRRPITARQSQRSWPWWSGICRVVRSVMGTMARSPPHHHPKKLLQNVALVAHRLGRRVRHASSAATSDRLLA